MKLRVLGCSGGIGGRHLRTTSFLLDGDILIDAGTGVGDLTLAELSQIDHIFVTHSHLDHVTSIPFLVDTVGGMVRLGLQLVVFTTQFRKLGLIEYNGTLKINSALLSVVLHD